MKENHVSVAPGILEEEPSPALSKGWDDPLIKPS